MAKSKNPTPKPTSKRTASKTTKTARTSSAKKAAPKRRGRPKKETAETSKTVSPKRTSSRSTSKAKPSTAKRGRPKKETTAKREAPKKTTPARRNTGSRTAASTRSKAPSNPSTENKMASRRPPSRTTGRTTARPSLTPPPFDDAPPNRKAPVRKTSRSTGQPTKSPSRNTPILRGGQQSKPILRKSPVSRPSTKKSEPIQESSSPVVEEKINIKLDQSVAILIDGNNIEMSLHTISKSASSMINFDKLVPKLLNNRSLSRLIYFREGKSISKKLAGRLQKLFHGSVVPCHKSADIPLSIKAVQIASKVDTIIILSGDADYVELVRHLKHDGIRVEIAAFPQTSADILLSEADYFFPITTEYSFALK